ncbi:MAG: AtpZ/AtpI family protein [Bacteroidales bacterium]|nr:AtpZ/AtpI family protein [Bacteroidales bacterium]
MSEQDNGGKQPKNSETFRALAHFSQIGVTMAASVLIGVLLGKYLDGLLGTSPWLLLFFSLLGAGAAIKSLFNISSKKKQQTKPD